jgi:nucleotide-binding universal stress UspA family protein
MQAPFGRTLAGVIGSTDRPVLAIRPEIQESRLTLSKISQVILPLDGSPGSAAAVNAALNLTHNFGGRLALIHVPLCHKAPPGEPGSLAGPRYLDAPHHERIAWDQEFMRRFGPAERANSELIDLHTSPGDPVQEILRIAENRAADLIAIAWRRNLDSGRAEIAKRLLAESNCPILFVPARNQEDGR